ncbi:axin interactor, dorsalization-associated protein-like [Salvelinus fontinalis]|uniref:axin interactor, dorsalization-associated protein-like n=1 Tax=Salvelinus fontinalis TaxID=8038 RepID=UPI00248524EC|nr:axin interactor, dorsalization-associated protein-like [Salvelinus fontinalis]
MNHHNAGHLLSYPMRILAPGEEENLEVEEEEDAATGAGSPESFPNRVPGTLLPRLPSEPRMSLLTIKIDKIGLKDAGKCIDPYMTVSVKDLSGIDLNPVQDTPVATLLAPGNKEAPGTKEHITVLACFNASWEDVPPFIIYPKCFPVGHYTLGGLPQALYGRSNSGYIDGDLFR